MRSVPVAALALSALLLSGPASGDDPSPDAGGASSPRPGPTLHGALQLSLADALSMGLENNLGVEIERHAPLIAREDHKIAWGAYDPAWEAQGGLADDRLPNSFQLAGVSESQQERQFGQTGIRGLLPLLNTSFSVVLDTQRLVTNSGVQALSPEYRTTLGFVARQPLLRNLIWNQPWTQVRVSKRLYEGTLENFRRSLMDTVQAIENAYWALVADEERVRVAEKSLETARALLEQVNTQFEVGVVSRVEIAEAEAGVADRDFNTILARNQYQSTMDSLIDLVLGPNLTADSRIRIEPTDRPDQVVPSEIDAEQAAEIAFENRPELAAAEKEIERLKINTRFAKSQRLPQLDVQGRYGHDGLSGRANPNLAFGVADPSFFGPAGDSFEPRANSFEVLGLFSVPIGNVAGRHGVARAELELRRAKVRLRRVEQDIVLGVREAVRNIDSAQQGIEAARRGVVAAEEQLRAERIRLEYGESTPFDVLQREEGLVRAESQEIAAFQTYRSSVTGLDRAQGTILRNRNISIEEASRLR